MTVAGVLASLVEKPGELLIRSWNWKASVFSSLIRGLLFLATNMSAGLYAAAMAGTAEFLYRAITAGFYGAITQSFRRVEPRWKGTVAVAVLLPVLGHSIELVLHWLRGTPNLVLSIVSSACLTLLSTTFNLYAMQRGTLVVGTGERTLLADLRAIPGLIAGYLLVGPRSVFGLLLRGAAAIRVGL
jgi:hypothetical protein